MMPWRWYFTWYVLWPIVLGRGAVPLMTAAFFCRFCQSPVRWIRCAVYAALSLVLAVAEYWLGMMGSAGLILETLLLAAWGRVCQRRSRSRSMTVAVLLLSIYGAVNGILSWAERRLFFPAVPNPGPMICLWDGCRELIKFFCLFVVYTFVLKHFGKMIEEADEKLLAWMAVPVFFLSMLERVIRNSLYGDNLVTDTGGRITTVLDINHGEMLALQVSACLCLFLTMAACQRIVAILGEAERTELLRQQIRAQEIYVQEAETRLRQTRGFRHDIKNHLMVLSELLRRNQTEEAERYLKELEQASLGLSMEIRTGNSAVSALLGSKISAAKLEGIQVQCDLVIPENSGIEDMDWCVLLANGVDNAIKACEPLPKEQRRLRIKSQRKGNFYLITVENSCDRTLSAPPPDGTGLSNIRSVAEKYGGRVENTVLDGIYQLKLLLTTKTGHLTSEP